MQRRIKSCDDEKIKDVVNASDIYYSKMHRARPCLEYEHRAFVHDTVNITDDLISVGCDRANRCAIRSDPARV